MILKSNFETAVTARHQKIAKVVNLMSRRYGIDQFIGSRL
jgi:hypothetical protein